MTKTLEELEAYYTDRANWRPPSLSMVAKFLERKSKRSAKVALEKLTKKINQREKDKIWGSLTSGKPSETASPEQHKTTTPA